MTFREQLQNDLTNVFFNANEFATSHVFDDTPIVCVMDDDLLQENKLKSASGVYNGTKIFHVSANQLEGKPVVGGRFTFDSETYYLTDCKESDGMYTITLSINKEQ